MVGEGAGVISGAGSAIFGAELSVAAKEVNPSNRRMMATIAAFLRTMRPLPDSHSCVRVRAEQLRFAAASPVPTECRSGCPKRQVGQSLN
jgi:hypothetical protein